MSDGFLAVPCSHSNGNVQERHVIDDSSAKLGRAAIGEKFCRGFGFHNANVGTFCHRCLLYIFDCIFVLYANHIGVLLLHHWRKRRSITRVLIANDRYWTSLTGFPLCHVIQRLLVQIPVLPTCATNSCLPPHFWEKYRNQKDKRRQSCTAQPQVLLRRLCATI